VSLDTRLDALRAHLDERNDVKGLALLGRVEAAAVQDEDFEEPEEQAERQERQARRAAEIAAWLAAPDMDELDAMEKRIYRGEQTINANIERMMFARPSQEIPTLQGLMSRIPEASK
jgi:citrate synthase